jgi:hypothetical protein
MTNVLSHHLVAGAWAANKLNQETMDNMLKSPRAISNESMELQFNVLETDCLHCRSRRCICWESVKNVDFMPTVSCVYKQCLI